MSTSQYFVRTPSRRFPTRSDSTEDFLLMAAEIRVPSSRCSSPSISYRRQVALYHNYAFTTNRHMGKKEGFSLHLHVFYLIN